MHSVREAHTKFLQNWIRKSEEALVILVRLCFSRSCITPIYLVLYVRCKCLFSGPQGPRGPRSLRNSSRALFPTNVFAQMKLTDLKSTYTYRMTEPMVCSVTTSGLRGSFTLSVVSSSLPAINPNFVSY